MIIVGAANHGEQVFHRLQILLVPGRVDGLLNAVVTGDARRSMVYWEDVGGSNLSSWRHDVGAIISLGYRVNSGRATGFRQ